jgi:Mg-chelatase subunit ChlD
MSTKPRFYQVLAAVCSLGGACAAEQAAPSSRTSSRNSDVPSPLAGGNMAPTTLPVVANAMSAAAGASAPLLQPTAASAPVQAAPGNVCEVVQLVANTLVPDMMIVLDRSGSMEDGKRWAPSVSAVRKITTDLQSRIRFGLALFPEDGMASFMTGNSNGSFGFSISTTKSVCTPGKIVVPIADMNAGPIGMQLDMTRPGGGTPTSETLMNLIAGYAAEDTGPDVQQHPKYVLLVTDGAPTCPTGGGSEPANQADIDATNKAVEALTAHKVKTYVIGYDTATPGNEMLAQVLDGLAQRGGTGDQKHRPVEDEASLTAALDSITATIATCNLKLDKAPPRADYVRVTLDGTQLNLDDPNGWRMVDDHTVEIVGSACTTFKAGSHAHTIDAKVQCMVVTPS